MPLNAQYSFNWKNKGHGYEVRASEDRTPDNQKALKVTMFPSKKRVTVSAKPGPDFSDFLSRLDMQWDSISFWFKPDDSGEKITLVFSTIEDGKIFYYAHLVPLTGSKWRKVEFNNLYNRKKKALALKFLKNIFFYATPSVKTTFLIGPVKAGIAIRSLLYFMFDLVHAFYGSIQSAQGHLLHG